MQNRKGYEIDQSPFFKLGNKRRLAGLLKIEQSELRFLSRNANSLYSEFDIPKKSGGLRRVENPRRQLKLVQAKIARLLGRITPPDYLFCPVKGRSYVSNAAAHRHGRVVRCLDIRKYFPSTSSKRVYWFFNSVMKCSTDIAAILTNIACYSGHLPTGSPLSPIMAYYAHHDLWQQISAICNRHGYILTVYIDDVTVSGQAVSAGVMWEIRKQIHKSGLNCHKEKSFIDSTAEVTGVVIRDGALYPPNRQLKKLRDTRKSAAGISVETSKKALQESINGLSGQIKQIRMLSQE
jgi:hypothetical protein